MANERTFTNDKGVIGEAGEYFPWKKDEGGGGGGMTEDVKQAFLNCFSHVAWTDEHGQDYYDALEAALYPSTDLVSISAVYTQSGTVYDTDSLDSLRADLVVTATYSNGDVLTVTTYTLSGTLAVGTSTITVTYGGKSTTFTVVVTAYASNIIHSFDFTQSLEDSVGGLTAVLSESGASRDENGLHITSASGWCYLGAITNARVRFEVDISAMSRQGTDHGRLLMRRAGALTESTGDGLIYRNSGVWEAYFGSWSEASSVTNANAFAGKRLTLEYSTSPAGAVAKMDGTEILTTNAGRYPTPTGWQIGSSSNSFYNVTITAIRVSTLED